MEKVEQILSTDVHQFKQNGIATLFDSMENSNIIYKVFKKYPSYPQQANFYGFNISETIRQSIIRWNLADTEELNVFLNSVFIGINTSNNNYQYQSWKYSKGRVVYLSADRSMYECLIKSFCIYRSQRKPMSKFFKLRNHVTADWNGNWCLHVKDVEDAESQDNEDQEQSESLGNILDEETGTPEKTTFRSNVIGFVRKIFWSE